MTSLFENLALPIPGASADPSGEAAAARRRGEAEALLRGLNPQQREAVLHQGGPLLIVAGAGSGKTRVLTRRIAWLISERRAHPGSILAITFTNKAAAEMKERVEELVGKRARIMWVSTFHSACVRILRKEITALDFGGVGYKSNFSIYDAADQKRLMTLVCNDLDLDPRRYQPGALLHWVSNHKNELRDADDVAADTHNKLEEAYAAAYTTYQRRLREANALDFDDLIMLTVHLFEQFPEVRETYRRRFRHDCSRRTTLYSTASIAHRKLRCFVQQMKPARAARMACRCCCIKAHSHFRSGSIAKHQLKRCAQRWRCSSLAGPFATKVPFPSSR